MIKLFEETEVQDTTEINEWFTSKEHYLEFTAAFKKWINDGNYANSSHFLLYAILRNKDWAKGWTIPTNRGKLVEHEYKKQVAFYGIKTPHNESVLLKPFDGTITTEMLMKVREQLDAIQSGVE